jgi:ABC-type Fe3+-siderophore transport system permease subunit
MARPTYFTTEYVVSLLVALSATYGIAKANPSMSPFVTYAIVPLAVSYVTIKILNAVVPGLNASGARISAYVDNYTLGSINSMGYMQIFPPLLAVTVLAFVLLFTRNLA